MILKRVLIRIFIVICIVILGCYIYVQYLVDISLNVQIPTNTTAVVRVNNLPIISHLALENGLKFRSNNRQFSNVGLEIPLNIIGYSLDNIGTDVYLFPLKVSDEKSFLNYVKSHQNIYSNKEYHVYQIKNKKFYIVQLKDQTIAICNLSNRNFTTSWIEAYSTSKFEKLSKSKYKTIKQSDAIISLETASNFRIGIDIQSGILKGKIQIPNWKKGDSQKNYNIDSSYSLDFWGNENFITNICERYDYKFPILKNFEGGNLIHAFWNGNTAKVAKQIDYTTDEDFNIVAKETTKEIVAPNLVINLVANNAKGIYAQFQNSGIICNDTITKDYFALWKFYSLLDTEKNTIQFSNDSLSVQKMGNKEQFANEKSTFALNINFQNPDIKNVLPTSYWKIVLPFDYFQMVGKEHENSLEVEFSLPLKNKSAKTYTSYFGILSSALNE